MWGWKDDDYDDDDSDVDDDNDDGDHNDDDHDNDDDGDDDVGEKVMIRFLQTLQDGRLKPLQPDFLTQANYYTSL